MKSLEEIKEILEKTPQSEESKKRESIIYMSEKTNSQQNPYTARTKVEETKNQSTKKIKGSDIFGYNQKFDTDNITTGMEKRFLAVAKALFKEDDKRIKEAQKAVENAVETKALTASTATPVNAVPNKFNMNTILVILIMVLLITIVVKSITLKQDKKQKPM